MWHRCNEFHFSESFPLMWFWGKFFHVNFLCCGCCGLVCYVTFYFESSHLFFLVLFYPSCFFFFPSTSVVCPALIRLTCAVSKWPSLCILCVYSTCALVRTLVTSVLTLVCLEPVSPDLININFIDFLCLTHLHPNFWFECTKCGHWNWLGICGWSSQV